jgi:hypothetical protein
MRFIIGILFMAVIIGACTWSGVPVARQTLGGEIAQVDITPDVEQLDDGYIQIIAEIGVSACTTSATSAAIGNCDVPEELLCDDSGTRECSQDCEDYLKGPGSCLVDWMIDQYDDIDSSTNSRNWCFKTETDYNNARGCLAGETTEPVDEDWCEDGTIDYASEDSTDCEWKECYEDPILGWRQTQAKYDTCSGGDDNGEKRFVAGCCCPPARSCEPDENVGTLPPSPDDPIMT